MEPTLEERVHGILSEMLAILASGGDFSLAQAELQAKIDAVLPAE